MTNAIVMTKLWMRLATALQRRNDDRGASLVEYALLVALIAIICIVAVQFLGESASSTFDDTGNSLANAN